MLSQKFLTCALKDFFCNYHLVKETSIFEAELEPSKESGNDKQARLASVLMDIVDGEPPGKLRWIGKVCREGEYIYVPDQESVDKCQIVKIYNGVCLGQPPN